MVIVVPLGYSHVDVLNLGAGSCVVRQGLSWSRDEPLNALLTDSLPQGPSVYPEHKRRMVDRGNGIMLPTDCDVSDRGLLRQPALAVSRLCWSCRNAAACLGFDRDVGRRDSA